MRLHAAAALTVALLYLCVGDPVVFLQLGGATMLVAFAMLGLKETRRAPLWLSPLSFYLLWYCFGLGISPIYIGSLLREHQSLPFSIAFLDGPLIVTGYAIFVVGSFFLHMGMECFRPRPESPRAGWAIDLRRDRVVTLAMLWAVGLVALFLSRIAVRMGIAGDQLLWLSTAMMSVLTLTPRRRLGLTRPQWTALVVAGTIGLAIGNLNSGSKAYLMFSFLPIAWASLARRQYRKSLCAFAVALMALYFLIISPTIEKLRADPLSRDPDLDYGERVQMLVNAYERSRSHVADSLDQFLKRQFDPFSVAYLVDNVATYGLQDGKTMEYAKYAFVPRFLWPDKPDVTRGAWFTAYLGQAHSEEQATSSTGMTAVGELYWNFSIVGVIGGMFLIGCLQGKLWSIAGPRPYDKPLHMLLYVDLMINMVNQPEALTVIVGAVARIILYSAIFAGMEIIRAPNRRRYAVAFST